MVSERYLKRIMTDILSDCITEIDLIQNTELIRDALYIKSQSHENLSLLKSQIRRAISSERKGTISKDDYEVRINKIHKSLLSEIKSLKISEVAVSFDYDEKEGIFYMINDSQGNHMYEYLGRLKNNLPHGHGIAKYPNGSFYEGEFKKGLREGSGKLMSKRMSIIQEGQWKNDRCFEKESIIYYPQVKAAANAIEENNILDEVEVSKILIPNLSEKGLIAFPVEGDSMEPTIMDGDIVVCRQMSHIQDVRDNSIHVVCDDGNIWVKLLQKSDRIEDDNILHLISENYLRHRPIEIEINSRTRIFKVISVIKYIK